MLSRCERNLRPSPFTYDLHKRRKIRRCSDVHTLTASRPPHVDVRRQNGTNRHIGVPVRPCLDVGRGSDRDPPPATCGGRIPAGSDPGRQRGYLFIAAPSRSLPGAEERGEPCVNTACPCFTVAAHRSSHPHYRGDSIDDVSPTATPPYCCKHILSEH